MCRVRKFARPPYHRWLAASVIDRAEKIGDAFVANTLSDLSSATLVTPMPGQSVE